MTNIDEARVISVFRHKSKFNFELFEKKNQFFEFPCRSTREDLSIDVSIQCRTDIDEATVISTLQHKSKFEFRTFLKKKNQIFGFPCCSTCEDLSIDVSITNVGLILTKL